MENKKLHDRIRELEFKVEQFTRLNNRMETGQSKGMEYIKFANGFMVAFGLTTWENIEFVETESWYAGELSHKTLPNGFTKVLYTNATLYGGHPTEIRNHGTIGQLQKSERNSDSLPTDRISKHSVLCSLPVPAENIFTVGYFAFGKWTD